MISTHILDTSLGSPASGVKVSLESLTGNNWTKIDAGETNNDGRFVFSCPSNAGDYRIIFYIEEYFAKKGTESFFLQTPISFKVKDTKRSYHVPLLLNPFGYSTYRGS